MHFSKFGALAGLLGAAQAQPTVQPGSVVVRSQENEVRSMHSCSYDVGKTWKDDILYVG